jgi:hypothetical protein
MADMEPGTSGRADTMRLGDIYLVSIVLIERNIDGSGCLMQ